MVKRLLSPSSVYKTPCKDGASLIRGRDFFLISGKEIFTSDDGLSFAQPNLISADELSERELGMTSWLRCSLERGMLPGEYAVEMETSDLGRISLFAPEDKVKADENLVRVDVVQDNNGGGVVVYLPAPPFEVSSRTVKVPRSSIVKFE